MHHDASEADLILWRKLTPGMLTVLPKVTELKRGGAWTEFYLTPKFLWAGLAWGAARRQSICSVGLALFVCVPSGASTFPLSTHSVLCLRNLV